MRARLGPCGQSAEHMACGSGREQQDHSGRECRESTRAGVPFNRAIDNESSCLGLPMPTADRVAPFREAYERGGVYLFDEIDRSLPGRVGV